MDLIIQNANLEQITIICSRIANPSFNEMVDDERLESISKYINAGDTPTDAKQKWQEEVVDKAEELTADADGTKRVSREEIKQEFGFSKPEVKTEIKKLPDEPAQTELHLDGPPPAQTDDSGITLETVMKLAGKVAKSGKMAAVRQVAAKYKVKKLKDLPPDTWQGAFDDLNGALNG